MPLPEAGAEGLAPVVPDTAAAAASVWERTIRATSDDDSMRSPLAVLKVKCSGDVPPMSYRLPLIVSPLRSQITCCPAVTFAQSAAFMVPPVKSMTATSFCGMIRSCPLILMVNPTPPWSSNCALMRSPDRSVSVAFSCACREPPYATAATALKASAA